MPEESTPPRRSPTASTISSRAVSGTSRTSTSTPTPPAVVYPLVSIPSPLRRVVIGRLDGGHEKGRPSRRPCGSADAKPTRRLEAAPPLPVRMVSHGLHASERGGMRQHAHTAATPASGGTNSLAWHGIGAHAPNTAKNPFRGFKPFCTFSPRFPVVP